jgi:hypothetical protein
VAKPLLSFNFEDYYERSYLERSLGELFDVCSSEELSSRTRVLYVADPQA